MIRVTVWNENWHEQVDAKVAALYPKGIHGCIADFLGREEDMEVRTATLDMPEHGLTQEVLDNTDVLLWWGHCKHEAVADEIVQRVYDRVNAGMGLIVLHSGHGSKIFRKRLSALRSHLARGTSSLLISFAQLEPLGLLPTTKSWPDRNVSFSGHTHGTAFGGVRAGQCPVPLAVAEATQRRHKDRHRKLPWPLWRPQPQLHGAQYRAAPGATASD